MNPEFRQRLLENSGLDEHTLGGLSINPDSHYKRYTIRQKDKARQIEEPDEPLMRLQKAILKELDIIPLHPACMARPGLGIKDNAAQHIDAQHLLRVDIKGCYQSITQQLVEQEVEATYFITGTNDLMEVMPFCFCLHRGRWILPTGAPTSPALCNIALKSVDNRVGDIAAEEGYRYTRYLDDLILSTTSSERNWDIIEDVMSVLRLYHLPPNLKKSRWYGGDNDPMRVTGVSVGKKQAAPREIKRLTRARIHSLAKEGKEIDNVTRGYLAHIKDIDPAYYLYMIEYYKRKKWNHVGIK
jgi:RNA-directed DNA polymerase